MPKPPLPRARRWFRAVAPVGPRPRPWFRVSNQIRGVDMSRRRNTPSGPGPRPTCWRTTADDLKDAALRAMADALVARAGEVLAANDADVAAARGRRDARFDHRPARARCEAGGRQSPTGCGRPPRLPDPVGEVVRGGTLANGLEIRQVRVPFGVVGMIYEARPNVTRRRGRPVPQVGQRGAAARLVVGRSLERGHRRDPARRACSRSACRKTRSAWSTRRRLVHGARPDDRSGGYVDVLIPARAAPT